MSEWVLPIGVTLAALTLTYLFCIRPMRRGGGHQATVGGQTAPAACCAAGDANRSADQDIDQALERARAELARLDSEREAATRSTTDGGGVRSGDRATATTAPKGTPR